jgi:hypothetical protein
MHRDCASYALKVCPFLAAPSFAYSQKLPDGTVASENVSVNRPDRFGLGITRNFQPVRLGDGELCSGQIPLSTSNGGAWAKYGDDGMIESWLQVSCDGCDDDDADGFTSIPNTTRKEYKAELRERGWRSYGSLDYCPKCVKLGKHKLKTSIFDSDPS